jgi:hypothetical protein
MHAYMHAYMHVTYEHVWLDLHPERAGVCEHGLELAGEVERHDTFGAADEPAADEDGRHGGPPAAEHLDQRPLHLLAPEVAVQLVHQRVDGEVGHELGHRVAHTAGALGEHHHRPLRRDIHHAVRHLLSCFLVISWIIAPAISKLSDQSVSLSTSFCVLHVDECVGLDGLGAQCKGSLPFIELER